MDINACTCQTYFLGIQGFCGEMDDENVRNGIFKK
jgi:hypothetical protein